MRGEKLHFRKSARSSSSSTVRKAWGVSFFGEGGRDTMAAGRVCTCVCGVIKAFHRVRMICGRRFFSRFRGKGSLSLSLFLSLIDYFDERVED